MTKIKELRLQNNLTQEHCAKLLGISLRSYKTYENDESKTNSIKYKYLLETLEKHCTITEDNGVLTLDFISKTCNNILKEYNVEFCYLFGSYAKGSATDSSDVDLLISLFENGLKYYEILEKLRESLHKKVDLLSLEQLKNNPELTNEILKTGVKIYG